MIDGAQQLLTLVATGIGSYVALSGLSAWKREHTGVGQSLDSVVLDTFRNDSNFRSRIS
ncbi:MAG TPA: hypothetical protein VN623_08375 [Hyphomicrobium sp.]|jgi:hypothetical protein|nr:hypothetical protein [Hyphomicrobium sp.]